MAEAGEAAVDAAARAAQAAFQGEWGARSGAERGRVLLAMAAAVREHADELAELESRDTGKPLEPGAHRRQRRRPLPRVLRAAPPTSCSARRSPAPTARSSTRCASRWAWSPTSRRGTRRSRRWSAASRRRWPPVTRWWSSRRRSRRCPRWRSCRIFEAAGLPAGACEVVVGRARADRRRGGRPPARRPRHVHRLGRRRRGRDGAPPPAGSCRSASNWAASRPPSSCPTPTSTPRSRPPSRP